MKNCLEFWMSDYLDISCLHSTYWLHCCGINYCVSTCKWCNGNSCTKIIKNSDHLYVRNVLHIKLVKLQSIWISGSSQIGKNKCGTGQVVLVGRLDDNWNETSDWKAVLGLWVLAMFTDWLTGGRIVLSHHCVCVCVSGGVDRRGYCPVSPTCVTSRCHAMRSSLILSVVLLSSVQSSWVSCQSLSLSLCFSVFLTEPSELWPSWDHCKHHHYC